MTSSRARATIRVGDLPRNALDKDFLRGVFLTFGEILEIELPPPSALRSSRQHRGTAHPDKLDSHTFEALIEFDDPLDADAAIDNMHLAQLYNNTIKVTKANTTVDLQVEEESERSAEGRGNKRLRLDDEKSSGRVDDADQEDQDDDDGDEDPMGMLERQQNRDSVT
ncbi:hypothetical protein PYCC9005_005301 [Savitreella phatthalungensis]